MPGLIAATMQEGLIFFLLHKLVGYLFKNKYTFNIFILHLIFFFEIMVILLKIITTFLKTNTLSKEEPNTDLLSGISEDSSVSMKKSVYLKHVVETGFVTVTSPDRRIRLQKEHRA